MNIRFKEGDIHDEIFKLNDNCFDLIYTSPPYGITNAKWDKPLKWDILFPEMWRVLKDDGIIVLHASMPFTYELLKYETPKYHYTWLKNNSTNFFKAKLQPLRNTEEIFIYYKNTGTYNPQMIGDKKYNKVYFKDSSKNMYFGERDNIKKSYTSLTESHKGRYPTTLLKYNIRKDGSGISRTDDMIDYFIKTYSNKGDNVLDMTCCNNYVGKRCNILERNYLGIDINLT
jgi:ubiquinone/menaquinone biosynthesis C-methylase UbiE